MKSNAANDFVKPILVLAVICLVLSATLAVINSVTSPIIAETEAQIAESARMEVLPEADSFTELDVNIPEDSSVTAVYEATNGVGYVFMVTEDGYGGKDTLNIICSIDAEGNIVDTKTLSHSETAGLGTKIMEDDFKGQFVGLDSSEIESIDRISGATISSNHYLDGIRAAFDVYETVVK